jgi:antitoxin YefM
MQKTLHLLESPKNAKRLRESIAEFKTGKTFNTGLEAVAKLVKQRF